MKKKEYQAPTTAVVELKFEGVMCSSPGGAGLGNYNWNNPLEE